MLVSSQNANRFPRTVCLFVWEFEDVFLCGAEWHLLQDSHDWALRRGMILS